MSNFLDIETNEIINRLHEAQLNLQGINTSDTCGSIGELGANQAELDEAKSIGWFDDDPGYHLCQQAWLNIQAAIEMIQSQSFGTQAGAEVRERLNQASQEKRDELMKKGMEVINE